MDGKADIVVAGAGAIGSTVALALARAGRRVVVLDPAAPESSASGVAAGMLAPAFETVFDAAMTGRFALLTAARDLWPVLADSIGLPLDRNGALAVGKPAEAERWSEQLAAFGAAAWRLSPDQARTLAPGLEPGLAGVFTPDDWRLEPRSALAALRRAAQAAGARFRTGRVVDWRSGRVLIGSAEQLAADALVIATGVARDLQGLAPELAALTPVKGHILRAPAAVGPGPVVRGAGVYLCRGPDELVLGATMEAGRDDQQVDRGVVADLVSRAARLDPGLARLDWRAETGVRAATPDALPLVGRADMAGVILAVGARRNGWLLAPMIAQRVLAIVEGGAASRFDRLFEPARPTATALG
jgi:glycine oxidase